MYFSKFEHSVSAWAFPSPQWRKTDVHNFLTTVQLVYSSKLPDVSGNPAPEASFCKNGQ